MKKVKVSTLTPNPHSTRMYGGFTLQKDDDFFLFQSIRLDGIREPLIISKSNEVISGVRRYEVAQLLNIEEVPVVVLDVDIVTELDVIIHNLQRIKNDVQVTYEYEKVRKEIGSKQGVRLSQEKRQIFEKIISSTAERISDTTRKRVVSAVKINKELYPEKSEIEIWTELSKEVDKGKNISSILKKLEAQKYKIQNASEAEQYEDFEHDGFKIIQGDSLEVANQLEDDSIQCLMTSPPYYNFREYDQNPQENKRIPLGNEPDLDSYINALVEIFAQYKSKMKQTSSIFINVMDKVYKGKNQRIPSKICDKMEEFGFENIQSIMWFKKNPQYSTNQKVAQPSCEYILHFTKSVKHYYWNKSWSAELNNTEFISDVLYGENGEHPLIRNLILPFQSSLKDDDFVVPPLISTNVINNHSLNKLLENKGFKLTHSALYSYEVPMLCILPSTKKGDVCLDIFSGLGTTGIVAYATNRSYIGIENSKIYAAQSKARFIELFKDKFPEQFEQ
ncbi:MAG: DNA methyltransferase [Flavobacteriia bacterium]|jgi:DNA modification methylase